MQPSSYDKDTKMIEVACTQLDYQWWDASTKPGDIIIKNADVLILVLIKKACPMSDR